MATAAPRQLYKRVGLAVAFSPRLKSLLGEVAYHFPHLGENLSLLHVGKADDMKRNHLTELLLFHGLSPDHIGVEWLEGDPKDELHDSIDRLGLDLLIAGALEKENPIRYYLGSVAHNLVRNASSSLLLLTTPDEAGTPFNRLVVVVDYTESSLIALGRALRLAARERSSVVYVLRVVSDYGNAMVMANGTPGERPADYTLRTLREEKEMLRDLVDAAGASLVPVEQVCIEGTTGLVAAEFAREQKADLLVMPSSSHRSHFLERLFPSDMEWVLREIPCNLWVVR